MVLSVLFNPRSTGLFCGQGLGNVAPAARRSFENFRSALHSLRWWTGQRDKLDIVLDLGLDCKKTA